VQLAREPGPRLLLVGACELEAVRPVHGQRVDVQPLQRLEQRLAGAPVERHALLHFRGLRLVLEQEHVRERVAGPEHRHLPFAGRVRDLVAELVRLGDGLLQVLLEDLVGHRAHCLADA
jgi:hypothetical protein